MIREEIQGSSVHLAYSYSHGVLFDCKFTFRRPLWYYAGGGAMALNKDNLRFAVEKGIELRRWSRKQVECM